MDRTSSSDDAHVAALGLPTKRNNGPTRAQFQRIYTEGKRISGRFCRVFVLEGTGKVGWATAKAIGGKPQRNREKRRYREALLSRTSRIPEHLDCVVVIAASAAQAPFTDLQADAEAILAEITKRWAADSGSSS